MIGHYFSKESSTVMYTGNAFKSHWKSHTFFIARIFVVKGFKPLQHVILNRMKSEILPIGRGWFAQTSMHVTVSLWAHTSFAFSTAIDRKLGFTFRKALRWEAGLRDFCLTTSRASHSPPSASSKSLYSPRSASEALNKSQCFYYRQQDDIR